jgi:predicted murein hydrolase (TIGR00659 family)
MSEMLVQSVYFGVTVSLLAYLLGMLLKKKFQLGIFNPLLVAIVVTILVLVVCHVDYESYYTGAKYLSYLLTPATVCLAIPLYEQLAQLKRHWKAVLAGILSGTLTSLISVLLLAILFGLDHEQYVTLLPKSITTAIGMGVSQELGGIVSITVAVIIVTGVLGNIIGEGVCRLLRIREPVAKGVAMGTSSHAIGTARAMEMGQVEGAMSSLSIAVAGVLTVVGASIFAQLW